MTDKTSKAEELARKLFVADSTISELIADLHEYGQAVRGRDAEIAREVGERGPICDRDDIWRILLNSSEAEACASAISREPLP